MTDIKPCTVKGCRATTIHHHRRDTNNAVGTDCAENKGLPCPFVPDDKWTPPAAPRPTRKALNARIAALEAENADLHAEIADKKDRLARLERASLPAWDDPDVYAVRVPGVGVFTRTAPGVEAWLHPTKERIDDTRAMTAFVGAEPCARYSDGAL